MHVLRGSGLQFQGINIIDINHINSVIRRNWRGLLIFSGAGLFVWFLFCVPRPLFKTENSTVLESSDGQLLGARIAKDGQWRFPAPDSVPFRFKTCLLVFEDYHFYRHPGVNPFSLVRAVYQNIRYRKIVSGGSTLTMQVARLARPGKPRTVTSKIIEMIWALNLELRFSKVKILKMYVTQAPFGGNVVGVEAASRRYFNRPPDQLSWGESATLAVLPNSPSLIFPGKNEPLLIRKRNRLLQKLYHHHLIDSLTLALSLQEQAPGKVYPLPEESYHLLETAIKSERGKRIRTTVDFQLQQQVNQAVKSWSVQLQANQVHNACALVTEVKTGHVLAYTGNVPDLTAHQHGNHVDIIRSPRSSGSILKPFLYAALTDKGMLAPGQLIPDIPMRFADFTPENFSREFDGAVPAAEALARSLNVPAVRMLRQYGVEAFYYFLKKTGMTTLRQPPDYYGLSLILGGAETTLWDLAGMYTSLAHIVRNYEENDGLYRVRQFLPLTWISGTQADEGEEVTRPFLKASSAWLTLRALLEVNRPDEETGWEWFAGARQIAWKTGTSFGFRDGWAVGITRDFVVAVWCGNADGEGRAGLTGSAMAAPLMFEIFGFLPRGEWFAEPSDELVPVAFCHESGYLPSPWCTTFDTIRVPAGIQTGQCPWHQLIHLDKELLYRVNSDCYPVALMQNRSWFVLSPVMEYYYRRKHPGYLPLPPLKPGCGSEEVVMEFIYPREMNRIFIPGQLDGAPGAAVFHLTHRNPDAEIHWFLDNNFSGTTKVYHRLNLHPLPGIHTLTVTDTEGNQLIKRFTVADE